MSLRPLVSALAVALATVLSAASARADLLTKPLDKPFVIMPWNFLIHIQSIETVPAADRRPVLSKMNDCNKNNGYIVVTASVQNNSATDRARYRASRRTSNLQMARN